MMFPAPDRRSHKVFCETEKWQSDKNARDNTGHHLTYELALKDGSILRTRISHPPNKTTYGPSMWNHILRDQLCVSEAEFWNCVNNGVLPQRSQVKTSTESIPVGVAYKLINVVGLDEGTVSTMTKQEAIDRLNEYFTSGA